MTNETPIIKARKLLDEVQGELLNLFSNSPNYGSLGINIVLQDNKPVRIDTTRTITMKVQGGK